MIPEVITNNLCRRAEESWQDRGVSYAKDSHKFSLADFFYISLVNFPFIFKA